MKRLNDVYSQWAMNVSLYDPNSLTISFEGNVVVVQGKHDKITDERNSLTNLLVWRFGLPEGVKPEDVDHELSDDGILRFSAPLPKLKLPELKWFSSMSVKPKKEIRTVYKN